MVQKYATFPGVATVERKDFIGALAALCAAPVCCAGQDQPPSSAARPQDQFKQAWVKTLIETMDAQLDGPSKVKLLETCGRACARRGALPSLQQAAHGQLDALLKALEANLGAGNARQEGNVVHLRYTKCYCPLVGDGPERLPDTYCNCSRGWALEVFGTITGKPVTVDLISSIRRGDADCRFTVRIGA
jgi:hypothetical protein